MNDVLFIQHDDHVGPGLLSELLPEARLLRAWEQPEALTGLLQAHSAGTSALPGALVVLGGTMDAYADEAAPWLPATRELMRRCVADDVKVLAICLGHQLLAVATGGEVGVGAASEKGLTDLWWSADLPEDGPFADLAEAIAGTPYAWGDHADAVTRLPEGACLWATSQTCPQVFTIGSALGVQFHPEVTEALVIDWLTRGGADAETRESLLASYRSHAERLRDTCEHLAAWVSC
ncbi:type 1 glutamine amidotransferase [Schaalia sp. 19OD2882]|uniref:type 1 glutamine amidotransferase n=1 Tax=Schaalia sp. 19OD2882 TaxID=2794089 RepID=UPI001C1F0545|nr:type 1 glutamine amidotransferase [Schaalia sp. 19OD2882]QWW19115.1 type 1 glutamine amidotransferase [Schaalia sp. 19OD2882]